MSAEPRWDRVKQVFQDALDRTPDERSAFLREACANDRDLRAEVDSLLLAHEAAGSFAQRPAIDALSGSAAVAFDGPAWIDRPLVGTRLGPYEVLSALGAGGMGEVYRARDAKLGRDVAIKILPRAFTSDPDRLARFHREARTLASLNHPNIAAIYGFEASGDVDGLVLELVEGEALRGPQPIERALDYARQVAEALEAAHEKGVIHRDLKPANVKVTPQGRVKVLDFGLAKAIWGTDVNQDRSQAATVAAVESLAGRIVGTPGYMSPEQANAHDVDQRTDVWAFGCLLYELLSGKRAFQGETLSGIIAAVLEREPDWQALPANTPATIRELLRQCLQKDPGRRLQNIADARRTIEKAQRGWNRWRVAAMAAAALAALAIGVAFWLRGPARPPDRSQWVQLTNLPDSASQPALSPDGRMLAFIRGPKTFIGPGQIYVKVLPDGDPVQLTGDSLFKLSPAFSPNGARIAYTTQDPQFHWDTWEVSVPGGAPQLWLRNASGLVWTGPRQLLFSEIKTGQGLHMGIVTADENRAQERDVYLAANERAMAHRSYASPDGHWVLLVEMDKDGVWGPCRVVPMDGRSAGHQVGPPGADCTFGAWSRDGKWMYLTSKAGGVNHVWRQRFPDGQPEQITSGPTEEEGVAMAPDGRSFVTAMALQTSSVWVHDAGGERQISLEGIAAYPRFTLDGKKLSYSVHRTVSGYGSAHELGEVWVADLVTGRSQPLAPSLQGLAYDLSADGREVVMEVADREGKPRLWLAPLDRGSPARQIPSVEGREPLFGPGGEIFFRHAEGASGFVYRVHPDGTGIRKALERPIHILGGISPDGHWMEGFASLSESGPATGVYLFSLDGGPAIPIGVSWNWSRDGSSVAMYGGPIAVGRTYLVPLPRGEALPRVPAGGFHAEAEIARLPGAHRIDADSVVPGPSLDVYAFYRGTTQRNLYRIPIQ